MDAKVRKIILKKNCFPNYSYGYGGDMNSSNKDDCYSGPYLVEEFIRNIRKKKKN